MVVDIKQRIGEDLYILFEDGKFKYDISLFDDLAGKYVYATREEKDSLDYYITEGDYIYLEEGGNNYIEFVAGFPVEDFFSFKVLDVKSDFDRVTSIVSMADINPTNLNAEFDNLRDYMFLVQEIISKKALRYDADYDSTMLPKLNDGEFWIKTETGFRASNFETLEALVQTAFKDFFGIIGGEDFTYTFDGVTALDGDWFKTDTLGVNVVDGIAVQKGDSFGTYFVLTSGFVLIPDDELDDIGNPFVTNGYYYQSLTTTGKFSTICPVSGICKKVFKVIEAEVGAETIQYALILNYPHTIGDGTVFSDFIKYYNVNADMIADLTLGVNQRVDVNAELYKIVAGVQPIALDNGLYAELLENVQVGTNKTDIGTNETNIETNTTNIETNTTAISNLTPIGSVNAYVGVTAPSGWLICDGSIFDEIVYPTLYSILGDSNVLPDLRGEFIRGLDNGRGVDTGRTLLSTQTDMFKQHGHTNKFSNSFTGYGTGGNGWKSNFLPTQKDGVTLEEFITDSLDSTAGTETRPRNIAMNYIIKAE